ncbi:hypothetical protein [Anaeromyxobacter oryzisoli]|uniref:hypothetical protein n=1 Tax=Anaeromyxobacter oryzisoli TaxID=2925408 RepID=UPI001F597637|nr:hypothetical protein [Anaeromyxobacter sp. SG63]
MSSRGMVVAAAVAAALAWAAPARAGIELGAGADYLPDPARGAFQLTLAADAPIVQVPHVAVGGRFGVLGITNPGHFGIPIDARVRLLAGPLYLEGLLGPWIIVEDSNEVRFHGAGGIGVHLPMLDFGLEIGSLAGKSMIGLRFAVPIPIL